VHIIEFAISPPPVAEGGYAVRKRMHDHEATGGTARIRPGSGIMSNRGGLGLAGASRAGAIIRSNEREETAAAATVYLSTRRSHNAGIKYLFGRRQCARDIQRQTFAFDVKCVVNMKAVARENVRATGWTVTHGVYLRNCA